MKFLRHLQQVDGFARGDFGVEGRPASFLRSDQGFEFGADGSGQARAFGNGRLGLGFAFQGSQALVGLFQARKDLVDRQRIGNELDFRSGPLADLAARAGSCRASLIQVRSAAVWCRLLAGLF